MPSVSVEVATARAAVFVEAFAAVPVSRVGRLRVSYHLRMLATLVSVLERVLFHRLRVGVGGLLGKVELTVHVEVVDVLVRHALLGTLFGPTFVVRTALAVRALLLDDELLPGVGIDLGDLGQLLLLLKLGLLLLVLLEALLALVAGQLGVWCALRHVLRSSTA